MANLSNQMTSQIYNLEKNIEQKVSNIIDTHLHSEKKNLEAKVKNEICEKVGLEIAKLKLDLDIKLKKS